MRKICLLGGTGFVGRHLVNRLANSGWRVKILTRRREQHRDLLVLPTVEIVSTDIHDQTQLNEQMAGCEAVINLVGILNEIGNDGQGFRKVHVELPRKIVNACKENAITRLLHLSALNADAKQGKSHYLRSKGEGEALVHAAEGLQVTSFRPSVIFGEDDSFLNRFASLLQWTPYLFMLPSAHTKLAPVWVNNVVEALLSTLDNPQCYGQRYALCGPTEYTLQELVKYIAQLLNKRCYIMPLNDKLSYYTARVMEFVPGKPYSIDNYLSAQTDSTCSHNHLVDLGIVPQAIETIMPKYLVKSNSKAVLYSTFRCHARRN